ncbi:uncharacterized protein LOC141634305 isoform X2 [Silene latifolia]|uniref:uncharacterized protein LOC141634305 isoform X2 n=1 Tax=Silene latifolia TaxID=37657 RepID=UPI003D782AD3
MATVTKLKSSLCSLKSLLQPQLQKRFTHSSSKPPSDLRCKPMAAAAGHVDISNWKKLHSRSVGITLSMIPGSPRIVLRILQNEGYDAYLVGGCVRDLLRNKVPKDFDVITSANLMEIKKKFHRAIIVGRKFPICLVYVRGSIIEVSSFQTVGRDATEKKDDHFSDIKQACDAKDFLRWKNSLDRDFTINSLFYDPFAQRIYDYSNGMGDLRAMKLRTLVPAHLSFEEDCARILRGIRIAARLGFSFTKDTEKAIRSLYPSITTLDKGRLMMELNYMLSYGAAERSLLLLKRFNILELLLPLHAAYLAEHSGTESHTMLMKLFFNLDKMTSCNQPCNSVLCLLAFHLALVNNPQDAIVVWVLSSLLYHGCWESGVAAAREFSARHVHFTPEILKSSSHVTDEELSRRVAAFASMVLDSIDMLTYSESLCIAMSRYPSSPSSRLVLISNNAARDVSAIFKKCVNDVESLSEERCYYNIDYNLLGKGDIPEISFAFGKIVMDTMRSGVIYGQTKLATEKHDICARKPKVETPKWPNCKDETKQSSSVVDDRKHEPKAKKQKLNKQTTKLEQQCAQGKLEEILNCQGIEQKRQQLKKVVVKDVSLQEGTSINLNNVKVEAEEHHETQASREILDVMGKVSGFVNQCRAQAPEKILSVRKEQISKDVMNGSCLSNIFKEDKYTTKTDDRKEKQAMMSDQKHQQKAKKQKLNKQTNYFEQKCAQGKLEEQISKDVMNDTSVSNIFEGDKYTTKTDDRKEKQATMTDQNFSQHNIQRKEQISKDVMNDSSLSNIFKEDKYTTKTDNRKVKQATMSNLTWNKSVGVKRAHKLSGFLNDTICSTESRV